MNERANLGRLVDCIQGARFLPATFKEITALVESVAMGLDELEARRKNPEAFVPTPDPDPPEG